jgi:hypothetical protein
MDQGSDARQDNGSIGIGKTCPKEPRKNGKNGSSWADSPKDPVMTTFVFFFAITN